MTLLATVVQAALSGGLAFGAAAVRKRNRRRVGVLLGFPAIFSAWNVGGLIFAAGVAVFLALFFLWLRFVGHAEAGAKRTFFIVTVVVSALFLAQHLIHLPIRFALGQPPFKIAVNLAGIFLAVAMLGGAVEMRVVRRRQRRANAAGRPQPTSETAPSAASEPAED